MPRLRQRICPYAILTSCSLHFRRRARLQTPNRSMSISAAAQAWISSGTTATLRTTALYICVTRAPAPCVKTSAGNRVAAPDNLQWPRQIPCPFSGPPRARIQPKAWANTPSSFPGMTGMIWESIRGSCCANFARATSAKRRATPRSWPGSSKRSGQGS